MKNSRHLYGLGSYQSVYQQINRFCIENSMEIKKDKKVVITGKKVCLVTGILSGICGIYWLARAFFYDETNLPAILSCFAMALFLTLYAQKH